MRLKINSGIPAPHEVEDKVLLVEGDRLAILNLMTVEFLESRIEKIQENLHGKLTNQIITKGWSKGLMQTAYANGGSTNYIRENLKVTQEYHATGVKYLHKNSLKYDIGVYFEANGHGTLTCSEKVKKEIANLIQEIEKADLKSDKALEELHYNLSLLQNFLLLSNDVTGDAIINVLMVEVSLLLLGMSIEDLVKLYDDLPNKTSKCFVAKKEMIKTTYDELEVTAPECLKKSLDEFKEAHPEIRLTVRPSGTEDIVRIYVEAKTKEEVNLRTKEIEKILIENKVVN